MHSEFYYKVLGAYKVFNKTHWLKTIYGNIRKKDDKEYAIQPKKAEYSQHHVSIISIWFLIWNPGADDHHSTLLFFWWFSQNSPGKNTGVGIL